MTKAEKIRALRKQAAQTTQVSAAGTITAPGTVPSAALRAAAPSVGNPPAQTKPSPPRQPNSQLTPASAALAQVNPATSGVMDAQLSSTVRSAPSTAVRAAGLAGAAAAPRSIIKTSSEYLSGEDRKVIDRAKRTRVVGGAIIGATAGKVLGEMFAGELGGSIGGAIGAAMGVRVGNITGEEKGKEELRERRRLARAKMMPGYDQADTFFSGMPRESKAPTFTERAMRRHPVATLLQIAMRANKRAELSKEARVIPRQGVAARAAAKRGLGTIPTGGGAALTASKGAPSGTSDLLGALGAKSPAAMTPASAATVNPRRRSAPTMIPSPTPAPTPSFTVAQQASAAPRAASPSTVRVVSPGAQVRPTAAGVATAPAPVQTAASVASRGQVAAPQVTAAAAPVTPAAAASNVSQAAPYAAQRGVSAPTPELRQRAIARNTMAPSAAGRGAVSPASAATAPEAAISPSLPSNMAASVSATNPGGMNVYNPAAAAASQARVAAEASPTTPALAASTNVTAPSATSKVNLAREKVVEAPKRQETPAQAAARTATQHHDQTPMMSASRVNPGTTEGQRQGKITPAGAASAASPAQATTPASAASAAPSAQASTSHATTTPASQAASQVAEQKQQAVERRSQSPATATAEKSKGESSTDQPLTEDPFFRLVEKVSVKPTADGKTPEGEGKKKKNLIPSQLSDDVRSGVRKGVGLATTVGLALGANHIATKAQETKERARRMEDDEDRRPDGSTYYRR